MANVQAHGVPFVVAVNAFHDDPPSELEWVHQQACKAGAFDAAISTHWANGSRGAGQLAQVVIAVARQENKFHHLYDLDWPIKKKIETIATRMYGASGVSFSQEAEEQIKTASRLNYDRLPICMAKTPLSLSHDPSLKGRPTGFILPIQELRTLAGAGFLTAVCSGMQLLPGLPKKPATNGWIWMRRQERSSA